jgi:hypothetical protein
MTVAVHPSQIWLGGYRSPSDQHFTPLLSCSGVGVMVGADSWPDSSSDRHSQDTAIQDFLWLRLPARQLPRHVLFSSDGEVPKTGSDTKVGRRVDAPRTSQIGEE